MQFDVVLGIRGDVDMDMDMDMDKCVLAYLYSWEGEVR